jgi:hypothetical protein
MLENGFDDEYPVVRFIKPKLNPQDIKDKLLPLYDRGIVSKDTLATENGYDIEDEHERRKSEQQSGLEKDMAPPEVPFSKKQGDGGSSPNPQTKEIDNKSKKINPKIEVDQKTKLVTKRLKGSTNDALEYFVDLFNNYEDIIQNTFNDIMLDYLQGEDFMNINRDQFESIVKAYNTLTKEECLKTIYEILGDNYGS